MNTNPEMSSLLNNMVLCEKCSFTDKDYRPLAPVHLADKAKIMFIGENPSWEFGQRVLFDGNTYCGRALHENYIKPLQKVFHLVESDFWITDLFKCRYRKDVYRNKSKEQALIFDCTKTCAMEWLSEEIRLVEPKVIVTLGDEEVYQRLRTIFNLTTPSVFADVAYALQEIQMGGQRYLLFPACHPNVSSISARMPAPSKKWSVIHKEKFIKGLEAALVV